MTRGILTLALAVLPVLTSSWAQSPLGAYQVILDNGLFGRQVPPAAPPPPVATPPPTAPGWATEYRMTMITRDDDTGLTRVGIQNVRDGRGFLLIEADDSVSDFRLLRADFDRNQAVIAYRGTPHQFTLESGSPVPAAPQENNPRAGGPPGGGRRAMPAVTRPTPVPTPEPTPQEAPRFRTQEELDAHLREVQMDAIRTGKPPLPIPLTPEMDAQLVREGVLPPQ